MKTVTDMVANEPRQGDAPRRIPYPTAGWSQLASLLMAIVLSGLLLIYPRAVAASLGDVNHGLLTLLLWGISVGFIHGVGFVPRMSIWRVVFHPFIGWPLMAYGILSALSAT
jgi:cyd operon protein YbgE